LIGDPRGIDFDNFGLQNYRYSGGMSSIDLPTYIRKRARELGLTQCGLASRANLSRQTIVKIISGEVRDPRITTVIALARALEVAPFFMLRLWLNSLNGGFFRAGLDINGDQCSYVGGESVPNGMLTAPNQTVVMSYILQNSGTGIWPGRRLKCINVPPVASEMPALFPDPDTIDLPLLEPGSTHEIHIKLKTPSVPGMYVSYWKLMDENDVPCFPKLPPLDCVVTVTSF
jgi:DNA-binding XRE family transcriptional regulator